MRDALALAERVLSRLLEATSPVPDYVDDLALAQRNGAAAESPSGSVSFESLQRYFSRKFPDVPLQLSAIRELPGGRSKRTLLISLQANAIVPQLCVLRQDKPESAQHTSVRNEWPAMLALHRAGAAVAEPLWLDTECAELGAPFLVMRFVPGATPGTYWSATDVSPALGRALARALATLHRVRPQDVFPDSPPDAKAAVAAMLAAREAPWRASDPERCVAAERSHALLRAQLNCIDGECVAVHGDVHFGNVLAQGDKLLCLTDWEFVHAGHPAEDLAFCRSYVESIMPWTEFMLEYVRAGGRSVTESQLGFFRVWTYLRNFSLAAAMRGRLLAGAPADMQSLLIAVDALPRLEAMLQSATADEITRASL
jgi:aminoglycoside phosphotransferase (APT) family kinase protein